jgi:hypothetical protein
MTQCIIRKRLGADGPDAYHRRLLRRFFLMRSILGAIPLVTFGLAIAGGCSSDEGGGSGGSGGSGGGQGACWPTDDVCYVAGPTGPGAECLAKADNSGSPIWQGRLTSIQVTKPDRLAQQFVQNTIIDKGVTLNQDVCNETGDGTFSWLFEFDSTTNKLRTGGGLPVGDPKAGGCLVSLTTTSLPVAPIEVDVTIDGENFSAQNIDVYVPIFLDPADTSKALVLPLHGVEFAGKFNDDTHNCIGSFNGDELLPTDGCRAAPPARAWKNGGTLKGYITIAEADQVFVEELGSTLCVYIAGTEDWKGPDPDASCATSAKWVAGERPPGDWCSTTNAPADGTCQDAWRLEGEFAAAAFDVTGDCP